MRNMWGLYLEGMGAAPVYGRLLSEREIGAAKLGFGFVQHEGENFLGHGRIPHRRERLAMKWRRTMFAQSCQVPGSAIALVRSQSVNWKNRVPFHDHAVTFDFRDDRCRRDGCGKSIAVNDRLLWKFAVQT